MRGSDQQSGSLFSYVHLEARVAKKHPLRLIRDLVNEALSGLDDAFDSLYADEGRPSIAPERLLRASLLQMLYTIRSERQLMDRIEFDMLFRWFIGLGIDDPVWDASTFSKNRDRLLTAEVAQGFLSALLSNPRVKRHLSHEHFSVDGTLLNAWASMKSFQPKDGPADPPGPGRNAERDFKGRKHSNETHASTTDPDARLYRKGNGKESRLCYMGHALMENRNGLAVGGEVTHATGTAEREAALSMLDEAGCGNRRITLGGDKGYDASEFIGDLRERNVTPHIAVNGCKTKSGKTRKTAIDKRTTRHAGYAISQVIRKRIEEIFGWLKTTGGLAKMKVQGLEKVKAVFTLGLVAYNLVRIPKLLANTG